MAEKEGPIHEALNDASVMQDDLRDLLDALGLFSGARLQSPHEVMREAIAEVERIRRIATAAEALASTRTGHISAAEEQEYKAAWAGLYEAIDGGANG